MIITAKKFIPALYRDRPAIGCVFHGQEFLVITDLQNPPRVSIRADKRPLPWGFNGIAVPPRLAVFFL
jgi:hypothetical protein